MSIRENVCMCDEFLEKLTGVVISAAWSSRRSAASSARKRAKRARARGVVVSCWTGSDRHVSVDVEVVMDPDACSGFWVVAMTGAEGEPNMDILTAAAVEGGAGENVVKVMLDDDDGDIVMRTKTFFGVRCW
jgi:hypothetical protein